MIRYHGVRRDRMVRTLPPLAPLLAFDAVVRHGSFTRAAAELGVTQSAVSHQLKRLEQHLDARLVERLNPGIRLTDAGRALAADTSAALDALGALEGHRRRAADRSTLTVSAGAALSNWWLIRRLPRFTAAHPGIAIELAPSETGDDAPRPVDIRIFWVPTEEAHRTTTQRPLFSERVFPVCAPSLLPNGRPLADPRGLLHLPLLHKDNGRAGEWSWSVWLQRLGLSRPEQKNGELRFSEIGLSLTAALNGIGVALCRSLLVHDALAEGRLVPALADTSIAMTSSKLHVARWTPRLIGDRRVDLFVSWMAQEAERTVLSTPRESASIETAAAS
ncbi:LysR family transcriptional regulator [Reyranella sp. CPCC 100927]|nr:LysR family transcriptional regulator [Reyranella sp. CPCC 100927]